MQKRDQKKAGVVLMHKVFEYDTKNELTRIITLI